MGWIRNTPIATIAMRKRTANGLILAFLGLPLFLLNKAPQMKNVRA